MANYVSKLVINNVEYLIKDSEAREGSIEFIVATEAGNTPAGVTWDDHGTTITGTLTANDAKGNAFYLVPDQRTEPTPATNNDYREFVAAGAAGSRVWEEIGTTHVSLSGVVMDVTKGDGDNVLGEATTFTAAASNVTFSGGTNDSFVKSYPGAKSKLETTSVKGVGNDVTFNAVSGTPGTVTATNTVLGTATSASKITTENKSATYVEFGTANTASKATAGTAVAVAKAASAATNVSYVGDGSTNSVLSTVTYTAATETLTFGNATVVQSTVTGTNGTESITPYTFSNVTVPNITDHSDVSIASVKTNDNVAVPVISSNEAVTASAQVTVAATTAATSAASATTVATGSLDANDTVGAEVMTGLGTAVTSNAVTSVGTATAAAQSITVGTNDKVKVVKYNDMVVTKHQ